MYGYGERLTPPQPFLALQQWGGSSSALLATAHSLVVLAAHAQTLDSVPLDLSRQLVDLRELYSWRSLALYGHNVSVGV
jgi:hypothetical protein